LNTDTPRHFAAVDLGSNSFHMVVVRELHGDLQTLFKHKERVRLASGLNSDDYLDEDAIERGVAVLKIFAEQLLPLDNIDVKVIGTHTLRQAKNRGQFLRAAAEVFPFPIEVISGQEEARLIYLGVAQTEQLTGNTLVIDIGGGSTEIAIGNGMDIQFAKSHQMGCVSFTQRFFEKGITKKSFKKAKLAARQRLERFEELFRRIGWDHVRISSGTAQAVATIAQNLDGEFEGVTPAHIQKVKDILLSDEGSDFFKSVSDERQGVLAAGVAILEAIFDALNIKEAEFSSGALREGVFFEMTTQDGGNNTRQNATLSLMQRYHVDEQHAERVRDTALYLWDTLAPRWKLPVFTRKFLGYAGLLHEIGLDINSSGMQKHSAYIMENSTLPGFSFEQQMLVAAIIRQHRKRIKLELIPDIKLADSKTIFSLIMLLRLAIILHLNRHPSQDLPLHLEIDAQNITLYLPASAIETHPLIVADIESEISYLVNVGKIIKLNFID